MMTDLINDLTRVGFTEYEAKVYLALLEDHPATGYQLSKSSGVPRSMTYETLGRLRKRGVAMETVEGRATLYHPLPPSILLDRYEENRKLLLEELRAGLDHYVTTLDQEKIWSISGKQQTMAYMVQMIRQAQEEIFMVLTDEIIEHLYQDLTDADSRGLTLNFLLTGEAKLPFGNVTYHPPFESQLQELHNTLLVVVDNRSVLISSTGPDNLTTITNNRNLVLIARQFVWMELFAQRIASQLSAESIDMLNPQDQKIISNHIAE